MERLHSLGVVIILLSRFYKHSQYLSDSWRYLLRSLNASLNYLSLIIFMFHLLNNIISFPLITSVVRRGMKVLNAHKPFPPCTPNSKWACFVEGTDPKRGHAPNELPVAVWPEFISLDEENRMVDYLDAKLQKKPYYASHFDSVICNYREQLLPLQMAMEQQVFSDVVKRVREMIFHENTNMEDIHVLDIAENGFIAPHVDTEFTGGIVAGVTLLSDAVVTFQPHEPELQESLLKERESGSSGTTRLAQNSSIVFPELPRVELLVPARSLYIITGDARYNWTHAIEVGTNHTFNSTFIPRTRRISLMFRDELPKLPNEGKTSRSGSLADYI